MSYNDEAGAVEEFFKQRFTNTKFKVYYENMEIVNNEQQPHIRLLIMDGPETQASMGASTNVFRNTGFIVCEIRHNVGQGSGGALMVADEVAAIFRAKQFSGITTLSTIVNKLGKVGGWYQVNVLVSFRRDAIF